jgi:hypothetical protein
MTQSELNETALDAGIPGGNSGDVEYRIKANYRIWCNCLFKYCCSYYTNYFPLLRFYLPGGYQSSTGNATLGSRYST